MKFFMYTDGRTGSTAICEEIGNHSQIHCWQELFTYSSNLDDFLAQPAEIIQNRISSHQLDVLTFEQFKAHLKRSNNTENLVAKYLDYLQSVASNHGKPSFGFKLLYNHAAHWNDEQLLEVLLDREFLVLHNLRLDFARKYISGAIAKKTGLWNTKEKFEHKEMVVLDPDLCIQNIATSLVKYRKYEQSIRSLGFKVFTETYEDYIKDRTVFLDEVFSFLQVSTELVANATWKKVTPDDLAKLIENYEEFKTLIGNKITVATIQSV